MHLRLFFALSTLFAVPAAAVSVQQDFDAAEAKLDAEDYPGARDAFTALLARFPAGAKGAAVSVVRARLGNALIALNDSDGAVPMLEAALPGLKGATPADAELRALAIFDLGRAEESRGSLDLAARHYRAVLALAAFPADSPTDIGVRASLGRTLIWANPAEARSLFDGVLAVPKAQLKGDQRATVLTLRGRVELNNGNPAGARPWFAEAGKAAGGSATTQVSVADVRIRGDLALANILIGNTAEAQRFVALSGAGSLIAAGLDSAAERPLPACAPLTGLAPDAVAVIEFGIADDGRTAGVAPVYANPGSGGAGAGEDRPEVMFTKAVREWSWNPERIAKLDGFWRQAIRVELRCSTAQQTGDPVLKSFATAATDWQAAEGIAPTPDYEGSDALLLPRMRAELVRREAAYGSKSLQLLPALLDLAYNVAAPGDEREAAFARHYALIIGSTAPLDILTSERVREIYWHSGGKGGNNKLRNGFSTLLADLDAAGQGNSRAAMLVRLQLAEVYQNRRDSKAARSLLDAIVSAPESILPAADQIRTAALLRISNQAAADRDSVTAASALAATGLAPEQCALVDVKPLPMNNRIGQDAFPAEARQWSSEAIVVVGYDITAEGVPANVRTVFAMPPFAFSKGTEKAIAHFRFEPVFRPGNALGCSGAVKSVRFVLQPFPGRP